MLFHLFTQFETEIVGNFLVQQPNLFNALAIGEMTNKKNYHNWLLSNEKKCWLIFIYPSWIIFIGESIKHRQALFDCKFCFIFPFFLLYQMYTNCFTIFFVSIKYSHNEALFCDFQHEHETEATWYPVKLFLSSEVDVHLMAFTVGITSLIIYTLVMCTLNANYTPIKKIAWPDNYLHLIKMKINWCYSFFECCLRQSKHKLYDTQNHTYKLHQLFRLKRSTMLIANIWI